MSRIAIVAVLLACCRSIAFAQADATAQPQSPSQAAPAQPVHLHGSEMLGLVENKVMPQYPVQALKDNIQGIATFNVVVDETGKLVSVQTVSGHPALAAAGKQALSQSQFRPYTSDGNPVKAEGQMGFQFTLNKSGDSTDGHVECIPDLP